MRCGYCVTQAARHIILQAPTRPRASENPRRGSEQQTNNDANKRVIGHVL
jgi:hypothetical protein